MNKLQVINFFRELDNKDQLLMSCKLLEGRLSIGNSISFDESNIVEILAIEEVCKDSITLIISRTNENGEVPKFASFKELIVTVN